MWQFKWSVNRMIKLASILLVFILDACLTVTGFLSIQCLWPVWHDNDSVSYAINTTIIYRMGLVSSVAHLDSKLFIPCYTLGYLFERGLAPLTQRKRCSLVSTTIRSLDTATVAKMQMATSAHFLSATEYELPKRLTSPIFPFCSNIYVHKVMHTVPAIKLAFFWTGEVASQQKRSLFCCKH